MSTLQTIGQLVLNGRPVICPGCGLVGALDLDEHGPRETWPAWVSCRECGHGDDHPGITNGLVQAAKAARTGRAGREDADLFAAEWRNLILVGECRPQFVLDDALALGEELAKIGRQELRGRKTEARRWWRSRRQAVGRRVRNTTRQAAGTASAAALSAAWDWQTGGAGPQSAPHQSRCRAKGCRGGWVTITSRIHTDSDGPLQVPCGVCHRA